MRCSAYGPRATLVLECLEDRRLLTTTPIADALAVTPPNDASTITAQSTPTQPVVVAGSQSGDSALLQESSGPNQVVGTTSAATDPRTALSSQTVSGSPAGDSRQEGDRTRTNSWSIQLLNRGFDLQGRREQSFNNLWDLDEERLAASPTRMNQKDAPDFFGPLHQEESLSHLDSALTPITKNDSQVTGGRQPESASLGVRTTLLSGAGTIANSVDDQDMPDLRRDDREPGDVDPLPPLAVLSQTRLEEQDNYFSPAPRTTDLLAGLITFDAQALEHGIQNFLEQFNDVDKAAHEALDGMPAAPVAVTAAAAALALEMYRRRRRPVAPSFPAATRDESTSWTWVPGMSGVENYERDA